ncbi:hypothetical protein PoB_002002700 [Plakobranchus ocellatus]|uniref:Uncharacterized protein n=1 Tax=Plakobranchus ocellatus TaxID=259542 RepID=A0AAV3ZGB3_9GAST|nr:hypothetical protein PoB_002002700 [Plakobranchus ocellatus]
MRGRDWGGGEIKLSELVISQEPYNRYRHHRHLRRISSSITASIRESGGRSRTALHPHQSPPIPVHPHPFASIPILPPPSPSTSVHPLHLHPS